MVPVRTICVATGQAGAEIGAEIGADMAPTLNCNHEAPYVAHSLRGEGFDASKDGTGRGTPLVPVHCRAVAQAITSNYGKQVDNSDTALWPNIVAFDTTQITSAANYSNPKAGDPCHPLAAGAHAPAIAFPANLSGTQCASTEDLAPSMGALNPTAVAVGADTYNGAITGDVAATMGTQSGDGVSSGPSVLQAMRVRRLLPEECEKLQGFEPGYTAIPWRGKPADQCPDGPRYKALGNSWAVPCVRWIGRRIQTVIVASAERAKELG